MIEIDGNYGEGGGALVRTALALSALTGEECKIRNIRAGREKPGLKAQHLTAIKALKEICRAKTNEVALGSEYVHFIPGKIKRGKFNFDIGTAGSISLFLQAVLPVCMFAPGKVTLQVTGGTCGKWQASVDYIQNVLFPHLKRFVEKVELKVIRRGYFPKGQGEVVVEVTPRFHITEYGSLGEFCEELRYKCALINLTKRGELQQIKGVVNVSQSLLEKEIAQRVAKAAKGSLLNLDVPIMIRTEYSNSSCNGGEVVLWAMFSDVDGKMSFDNPTILGADALLELGKKSEIIGQEAAHQLRERIEQEEVVDEFLEDQLVVYMGLLVGSKIKASKLSKHTESNIYVTEKFLRVGFVFENSVLETKER